MERRLTQALCALQALAATPVSPGHTVALARLDVFERDEIVHPPPVSEQDARFQEAMRRAHASRFAFGASDSARTNVAR